MFEPNDDLEVKVARVKDRGVVIIDNFYKNPDEIRQLCLDNIDKGSDAEWLRGTLPGTRLRLETDEVREKLYDVFHNLCYDNEIWQSPYPMDDYNFKKEWGKSGFMVNIINTETLLKEPFGILPHQDYHTATDKNLEHPKDQKRKYGAVIYLNTPEECAGGTNMYSLHGQVSLPDRIYSWIEKGADYGKRTQEQEFNYLYDELENSEHYKVEHRFEMVYNRLALYPADCLHGQWAQLDQFTEYPRINQIFFM